MSKQIHLWFVICCSYVISPDFQPLRKKASDKLNCFYLLSLNNTTFDYNVMEVTFRINTPKLSLENECWLQSGYLLRYISIWKRLQEPNHILELLTENFLQGHLQDTPKIYLWPPDSVLWLVYSVWVSRFDHKWFLSMSKLQSTFKRLSFATFKGIMASKTYCRLWRSFSRKSPSLWTMEALFDSEAFPGSDLQDHIPHL